MAFHERGCVTLGQDLANIKEEDRPCNYMTVFLSVSMFDINQMDHWCTGSIGLQGPNWNRTSTYSASTYAVPQYYAIYYFDTAEHKFQFDLVWPN